MKRTYSLLLLALIIAGVGAGVYFFFQQKNKKAGDLRMLIPGSAFLLYEKQNCEQCFEEFTASPVWQVFKGAIFSNAPDSLVNKVAKLFRLGKTFAASVHETKKDEFDLIYFSASKNFNSTLTSLLDPNNGQPSSRVFDGITIHEIRVGKSSLSYVLIDDKLFACSFTPFLIEDVIRTYNQTKPGFAEIFAKNKNQPGITDDAGNIYVNLARWNTLLSLFSGNIDQSQMLGAHSALDVKVEKNAVVLNGFSNVSDSVASLLSIFQGQAPSSFRLKHLISDRAISVKTLGLSDGEKFFDGLKRYREKNTSRKVDSLKAIFLKYRISEVDLFQSLSNEIDVVTTEDVSGRGTHQVALINTTKATDWLKCFELLADKFSTDSVFSENYGNYYIGDIPLSSFTEKFFWPLAKGFRQNYYTVVGDVVVIADDLDELKRYITDIEEENTWGKSVAINSFIESTILESNYSLYVNTSRWLTANSGDLRSRWQNFVRGNNRTFKALKFGAIQFSNLNNSFYTNITWSYSSSKGNDNPTPGERIVTRFTTPIKHLTVVKSHVDRTSEILVQDSANVLSLVNQKGEVLWTKPLPDRIKSEVSQVDFLANGKLQYFFCTSSSLYIVDRLGNDVRPFPLTIPTSGIIDARVIDYDYSKRYRFLVLDAEMKLWMYDKAGENLEGWEGKVIDGTLAQAAAHNRIKGKDYLSALTHEGTFYLFNRRGEFIRNFPLQLNSRFSGDFIFRPNASPRDNTYTTVTQDGYLMHFDLSGLNVSKEPLAKNSVASKFSLVANADRSAFIIVDQGAAQTTILDENGEKMASNEFVGPSQIAVRYFTFGRDQRYVVISDLGQGLTYIHNNAGELITSPPIETTQLEIIPSGESRALLVYVQGESLVMERINLQ